MIDARLRVRLPGGDGRGRPDRLLEQANGSLIQAPAGRRLEARRPVLQRAALLPRAPLGRRPTTPTARASPTSGPNSKALAQAVNTRIQKILELEGPYNPGLTVKDIPVDAVTASGSGIDPDISKAYAELQARRIAAVRHLPLADVQS